VEFQSIGSLSSATKRTPPAVEPPTRVATKASQSVTKDMLTLMLVLAGLLRGYGRPVSSGRWC